MLGALATILDHEVETMGQEWQSSEIEEPQFLVTALPTLSSVLHSIYPQDKLLLFLDSAIWVFCHL